MITKIPETRIKLYKKRGKITGIEINGHSYFGITSIKINNDYTGRNVKESVVIEFSYLTSFEIVEDNRWIL